MIDQATLHHFGFTAPAYLVALAIVPALFAFALFVRRRRSRYAVLHPNLAVVARAIPSRRPRWWLRLPLILLALGLAAAALALARPRVQLLATDPVATVLLLVDVSGSMQATDIHPERIYAAITAMRTLVDELPTTDRVGLVTFSDKVEVLDAPTTDHAAVVNGLDVLTPQGGTALGDGVATAVRVIVQSLEAGGIRHTPGSELPAAIVLESDGAQNRGGVTPFAAGRLAGDAGVRIYGVALGTRQGYVTVRTGLLSRSIPVPPSPGTVALLARESGGQAFAATSASSLNAIYKGLGARVVRRPELTEITSWFDLGAAILIVSGLAAARLLGGVLP